MQDKHTKVLLIEDDPSDVRLLRETLAKLGDRFELECANRLSTGLGRLVDGDIAVLLLDLNLRTATTKGTYSCTTTGLVTQVTTSTELMCNGLMRRVQCLSRVM